MRRFQFLLILALAASGAAAQPIPAGGTNGAAPSPASAEAPGLTNVTRTNFFGYIADDKYKLRIGDRISFQITEDRDPPRSLVVADSGEVDMPYLGRVTAVNKTCKQLAGELKEQLEREYYYRATVTVALDFANRVLGRIYIWGQVRTQGPLEIAVNENLTVGKAILRAGGFGDFANKKHVKLIRGSGAEAQPVELNMVEILEEGKVSKDLVVKPDDFIIVPSRLVNF